MVETSPIRGLVVTHGRLGQELIGVAESILGPIDGLAFLSNRGLSQLDLVAALGERLSAGDAKASGDWVLFIDDFGGSCGTAAQLAAGESPRVAILSGVNLAMLLSFASWRDTSSLPELAEKLVRKGRESIVRVNPGRSE